MKQKWFNRIGAVLLAAVMAVGTVIPAAAEDGEGAGGNPLTEISVTLSRPDATMEAGDEITLSANIGRTPADSTEEITVSWSMEEEKQDVISITDSGTAADGSYQAKITALSAGTATVTVTATAQVGSETLEKKAYCEITVRGVRLTGEGLENGELTLIKGESVTLNATPYGAIGTSSSAVWISDSPSIAFVTSAGTVSAQNVGETKITVEIGNYSASCVVKVEEDESSVIKVTLSGATLELNSLLSQLKAMCADKLGEQESLSYLMGLSVLPEQGTLYYRYSSTENTGNGVGSTEKYYLAHGPGQLDLNEVSFVPNPEYTGRVTIQFFGYSATNNFFAGSIWLTVEGVADVSYSGIAGSPVVFQAADFAAVYKQMTGGSLRHVTFELPSVVQGTLYYNYIPTNLYHQPVTAGTAYYRDRSPQLDLVSFVPAKGSSGQVEITYYAYGAEGNPTRKGTVLISVAGSGDDEVVSLGTISYTAGESGVTFRGEDFNSLCKKLTGTGLNFLQFTPSTGGVLYYDYKGTKESVVTADQAFYMTIAPLISDITFLPDTDTKGEVTIPFTGVSTGGDLLKGTVSIQANVPATSAIRYSGNALPVTFSRSSFEQACKTLLKTDLAYIQFTKLPDASYGTLYQNFESLQAKGSLVTADTKCMEKVGDEAAAKVTFLPRSGFQGRTTLTYTGVGTNNDTFTGTVELYIADNYMAAHFTDMGSWKWAQPAAEFLYAMDVVSGVGKAQYGPGQLMKRGDFTLMLCHAFGFDTSNTYSFPDVSPDSYYAGAVAAAKDLGIVVGDETGQFRPNSGLLRQDAMVMLLQAMRVAGMDVPDGSYSSLIGFVDRESVSPYARNAMGAMVEMGVIIGDDHKQLNPQQYLNRAEMAVILHHILTM